MILPIKKNFQVERTGGHAEVADLSEYNRGSPQVKKAFFSENLVDKDMWYMDNSLAQVFAMLLILFRILNGNKKTPAIKTLSSSGPTTTAESSSR